MERWGECPTPIARGSPAAPEGMPRCEAWCPAALRPRGLQCRGLHPPWWAWMRVLTLNFSPVPPRPCPLLPPGLASGRNPVLFTTVVQASGCEPGPPLFLDLSGPTSKAPSPMPRGVLPLLHSILSLSLAQSHAHCIPVTHLLHACHIPVTHLSSPGTCFCSHQFSVVIRDTFCVQKASFTGSLSGLKIDIVLIKVQVKTGRRVSFSSAYRCNYATFPVELSNHFRRACE